MSELFNFLYEVDALFWGYLGFSMIVLLGFYLSVKTSFFQIRIFSSILSTFLQHLAVKTQGEPGVSPLKAFCASVGGMVGIGNIVGIATAIQIGGPGALFWVWIAGFTGSLIKYSEVYLGIKYRVSNDQNSYDGGPMYFLQKAFNLKWIPSLVCLLLCIYSIEIYQFNVVVDTLSYSWKMNRLVIAILFLILILYTSIGGVKRVSKICSLIMPLFIGLYSVLAIWLIGQYVADIPSVVWNVLSSAFTGHASIGGFAGSSLMLSLQNGMAGASYSADLGIGYDSCIQSETNIVQPEKQAKMAILGMCLDNFICTLTILAILVTGVWTTPLELSKIPLIQQAFHLHFYYVNTMMPIFIFVLGYTTLISIMAIGIKCSRYLHVTMGFPIFIGCSILFFCLFVFVDQTHALLMMRLSGALLLCINLWGIYRLRHEVNFF